MTRHAPAHPSQFALFDPVELEREAAQRAAIARIPASWASLPEGPADDGLATGRCLYDSPAQGFAVRVAEFALWCDAYGSFGSYRRSHAWRTRSVHFHGRPDDVARYQLDRHEPVPLGCDLRRDRHRDGTWEPVPSCGHDADAEVHPDLFRGLKYRGACRKTGCDWEGPVRDSENTAVEDGLDHAWPVWRDLPTVPRAPDLGGNPNPYGKARQTLDAWIAKVNAVYPAEWLESGGPIRTLRRPMETRHVECHTPFGGYDAAAPMEPEEDPRPGSTVPAEVGYAVLR